ncbi:hypothetical protein OROMI_002689 [Orobanche minor]
MAREQPVQKQVEEQIPLSTSALAIPPSFSIDGSPSLENVFGFKKSSLRDSSEHSWQATLGFFGLSDDPSDVINGLIQRDGRSRAEQLHLILRQRKRGCLAAYEMLQNFRTICKLQEEAALRLVDPSLRTSKY